MLVSLSRLDGPLFVQAVRQGHINSVNVGVSQQFVVISIQPLDSELIGKFPASVRVSTGHRQYCPIGGKLNSRHDDSISNASRSQNSPPDFPVSGLRGGLAF